jgi:hypothetical protein
MLLNDDDAARNSRKQAATYGQPPKPPCANIKHSFPAGKLPVQGKFRVTSMLIVSAAVSNVRRIERYLQAKAKEEMDQAAAPVQKYARGNRPAVLFGLF